MNVQARLVMGFLLAVIVGCSRPSREPTAGTDSEMAPATVYSEVSFDRLRNNIDPETCRTVLQQLDALRRQDRTEAPTLSKAEAELLQNALKLLPAEQEEINRAEYTPLDGHYLSECLLFHQVAATLEVGKRPVREQAERLFAWVQRVIVPRTRGQELPAPATYVVRRGTGDALEKSYVFVALAQQVGLIPFFVGPSDASRVNFLKSEQANPFWGVGVLSPEGLLVFDPTATMPWEYSDAQSSILLQELLARQAKAEDWLPGSPAWNKLPLSATQNLCIYPAVPLSGLAPRMQTLQEELQPTAAVHLRIHPFEYQRQLEAQLAKLNVPGQRRVAFWAPQPLQGYTQSLAFFHTQEQGGLLPAKVPMSPIAISPYSLYIRSLVPIENFPAVLRRVQNQAVERLLGFFSKPIVELIDGTQTPRMSFLRGQYSDAIEQLTTLRDAARKARDQVVRERDVQAAAAAWVEHASAVYAALSRARRGDDPQKVGDAETAVQHLWAGFSLIDFEEKLRKARQQMRSMGVDPGQSLPAINTAGIEPKLIEQGRKTRALVERITNKEVFRRTTFQLAQCMHERAERMHAQIPPTNSNRKQRQREQTQQTWKTASNWWQQYLDLFHDDHVRYPEHEQHAKRLLQRSEGLASD